MDIIEKISSRVSGDFVKKLIFMLAFFILFLPSFLFGFAYKYAETSRIEKSQPEKFVDLDGLHEGSDSKENNTEAGSDNKINQLDDNIGEYMDKEPVDFVDDNTLDSIKKVMEDPKVVETLASVAGDLDNVQLALEDENEKQMVLLAQKSLQEYMNEEESYKETLSEALAVYKKLNAEEKNRIMTSIMANVSWGEMLFLKRAFGL